MEKITINNLKELKLFSAIYAMNHDQISNKDKIQFLNFIKEANRPQLLFLLKKGRMVTKENKQLNEIAITELPLDQIMIRLSRGEAAGAGAIGGALAAAVIVYSVYHALEYLVTNKKCRSYKIGTIEYRRCHNIVKKEKNTKAIALLKSKSHLCKNSKDPAKCQSKIKEKISKLQHELTRIKLRIKDLEKGIVK